MAVVSAVVLGCATDAEARRPARAKAAATNAVGEVEEGHASYYSPSFAGRRTASGERYDPKKLTAAHKSLPLGTRIRVTRIGGAGASVVVRVNDRCGCTHGRIVDLSGAAASRLGMLHAGVVPVRIEVLN
ncbi:MAG TPA: septal ring lytic transglycosylase RlpA family protein [Polyangia bacterium]|nr:septal ring lytic transglycosylase RlpA family protein [Polyangia bacterium]